MTSTLTPQPGTIGLAPIAGDVGKFIRFGQWLNGDGFSTWEHAFVLLPGNKILEAEPGPAGAQINDVSRYGGNVYWCSNIRKLLHPAVADADLLRVADQLKGTPYSFMDYFALAAHRLHIPAPHLKKYISTSKHEICSQLADTFYDRLGTEIFTDDRWNGYVTPGMLYQLDLELAQA